jgi:tight adherence protein B
VIGLLLALCFASGIGLVLVGLCGHRFPASPVVSRLRQRLSVEELGLSPSIFFLLVASGALLGWILAWSLVHVPILAAEAAAAGGYTPFAWARRRRERAARERERGWPAALAQLADALEAGIAFPAAVTLVADAGPMPLRREFAAFHGRLRTAGLEAALDGLAVTGERTTDTAALLLRAGLLELPAGGLAPVLRELSGVLSERLEAREKARTRASSLQLEAAILAASPVVLLLLVGAATPAYLDAYKTAAGTAVGALGGALIFGCYLLMRRLGRIPEPRRTGAAK